MDAVSAFTQSDLKEEIYVTQPDGYDKGSPNKVCLLKKSLYGLKQASWNWRNDVETFMKSIGFKTCVMDENVFHMMSRSNLVLIMCLYVDDTITVAHPDDKKELEEIIIKIKNKFKIKDLGEPKALLGIRIQRDINTGAITLDQPNYIEKILKRFNIVHTKGAYTPDVKEVDHYGPLSLEHCPKTDEDKKYMESKNYRALVGSLLYLTICTRPDIAHAVSVLTRFTSNPGPKHWDAGIRILKYINMTRNIGLVFGDDKESSFKIQSYSDANWGNDIHGQKSIYGFIIFIGHSPISWICKKQNFVALSTCESEYVGISETIREMKWIHNLLRELKIKVETPILHGDNLGSLAIAADTSMNSRIKSIDIKYHFIKDEVFKKNVILKYVSTVYNIADIFTKPLDKKRFIALRNMIMNLNTSLPLS
ncbi:MAG: hypothetical protein Sylvanvirus5_24 [Sylvanvirus sp.]|uniref:Reverse transcriptase Ty1/copia-type domain-containing protein n=1 Tax=Sylvanvirus sp. TaxID=2487774 RepID=A0A3G5AHM7_9VIRU|nr:MAG: hypothetical protein Sylvanvirus5_24 [Sylvanvirus sp.]